MQIKSRNAETPVACDISLDDLWVTMSPDADQSANNADVLGRSNHKACRRFHLFTRRSGIDVLFQQPNCQRDCNIYESLPRDSNWLQAPPTL